MIFVGIALAAVAIGDLVAGGLACESRGLRRAIAGIGSAAVVVGLGSILFSFSAGGFWWLLLLAGGYSATWILLRVLGKFTMARAWACVSLNAVFLMLILGWGARIDGTGAALASWLKGLPYHGISQGNAQTGVLFLGVFLWLGPTANGIVRAVLTAAGAELGISEQKLRGGRVIGILERWMIFGFVLTGAPTAAAIIVSAKSILRFPELSEKASQGGKPEGKNDVASELNIVTEYLLLGSLVSWMLALAPVALFR